MRNPLLASALALLAALGACESGPSTTDRDIRNLGVEELARWRDESSRLVVVDVRSESAYARGHIPGAIHRPLPRIREEDPALDGAERIVVYGEGWKDLRVPAATKKLIGLGDPNVWAFREGFARWRETDRAVRRADDRGAGSP